VFIFAATNDVNSLDPALLRPGRFDSRFAVGLPDTAKDRLAIINLYLKNKKLSADVSVEALAKQTLGCSPATIEAIINEAAIESVKNGGIITPQNIDDAFYRQLMDGHKKKNSERSAHEIKTVAWHEAGHTLATKLLTDDSVPSVTIVGSSSGAGGVTFRNPKEDNTLYSKTYLQSLIQIMYAGRAAEKLYFGNEDKITTGASNDIERATKIARAMVTQYGMSEHFGLMGLESITNRYLDGRAVLNCGEDTAAEIDREVMKMLKNAYEEAKRLLIENRVALDKIAEFLIEKETITGKEFMEIFHEVRGESERNEDIIFEED
jgi:cell division protease FtsH